MPTPASQILAKTPMPTHLSSEEIRDQWSAEMRRRALFSARTTEAGYLSRLRDVLARVAGGQEDAATARMHLLRQLDALGYDAQAGGFPGAQTGTPDAGMQDLSGRRRLNLIIDTQRQMAASAAMLAAQTPAEVEAFPAWRLERYEGRQVPREDWPARWSAAGNSVGWAGALRSDAVALKSSPIWQALGDGAGGFRDALGNPYPPFAYSSGLNWSPVSAEECRTLGLAVAQAAVPGARLRPGEREIADVLRRHGRAWTTALLRDLEAS